MADRLEKLIQNSSNKEAADCLRKARDVRDMVDKLVADVELLKNSARRAPVWPASTTAIDKSADVVGIFDKLGDIPNEQ